MKYYISSFSALASVASASQIMGTYYMAPMDVVGLGYSSSDLLKATSTEEYATTPTSTYESTRAYTDIMPYATLTQSGYQQLDCGYGYGRERSSDYCSRQSWVRLQFIF